MILAAAALGAAFTSAHAQTQPATRIGYVNTERILRDAVPAKASQQKLEQEFSKRDKDLQEMAARLKAMGERNERDTAVTNESDRMRRQREFAELEKEFQRKQREFREDLNQRRNEELSQVVEKANRVIRQIAEEEKYDFILQEAVYASSRVDITEKVLRALGTPAGK
ncbi:OmpH family outer membrane protein [Quisquiliibacterium transsilvanicum]